MYFPASFSFSASSNCNGTDQLYSNPRTVHRRTPVQSGAARLWNDQSERGRASSTSPSGSSASYRCIYFIKTKDSKDANIFFIFEVSYISDHICNRLEQYEHLSALVLSLWNCTVCLNREKKKKRGGDTTSAVLHPACFNFMFDGIRRESKGQIYLLHKDFNSVFILFIFFLFKSTVNETKCSYFKTSVMIIQDGSLKIFLFGFQVITDGFCPRHDSAEVSHPLKYGANKDRMNHRLLVSSQVLRCEYCGLIRLLTVYILVCCIIKSSTVIHDHII